MKHAPRQLRTLLRPWALWFALLVAWATAIVPTVSHALAWSQGNAPSYLAICSTTVSGTAKAATPGSQDANGSGTGTAGGMQHCPFCLHANDRAAPPPHIPMAGLLPPTAQPYRAAGPSTTCLSAPLWDATPRGPPTFS